MEQTYIAIMIQSLEKKEQVLDKIKISSVGYNEIFVHMAMPVACAFTLGHVWMPKADLKLVLYDYYNNTENKTITIE